MGSNQAPLTMSKRVFTEQEEFTPWAICFLIGKRQIIVVPSRQGYCVGQWGLAHFALNKCKPMGMTVMQVTRVPGTQVAKSPSQDPVDSSPQV